MSSPVLTTVLANAALRGRDSFWNLKCLWLIWMKVICSKTSLYLAVLALMDQPYSYKGSDFNSATSSLFQKSVGRRKSARNSVRGSVSCLNSSTMPQLHHPACRDTFFLRSSTNLQANSKDFWDLNLVSSCQLCSSMNSCLGGIISTRLIIGQPSLFFSCIHILVDTAPGNAALITHHTMQGLCIPRQTP